jgi:anti-sigma regulatory factor (Ser/Thr protein kinase)
MQKGDHAAASSTTTAFANDAQAPGNARRALDGFAPDLPAGRMHEARILVTELVTNSVRHASGDSIELALRLTPVHLVIEVTDGGGADRPRLITDGGEAALPHGWGLRIVETLTESWGVRDAPGRRTVWCELRIDDDEAAPRRA